MARFCELSIGPSNISGDIARNTSVREVDFERPGTRCRRLYSSCPALCRASTSSWRLGSKTWMAGTSPAMTEISDLAASHRRAKHPGRELGAAEIKTFALGRLAGGGLQHQV